MAINPFTTGNTRQDLLAFALAGVLGVPVEDASDLLTKATNAAQAADFAKGGDTDDESDVDYVDADYNSDEDDDYSTEDRGIGFHDTTVAVTRGRLKGNWSLRCASPVYVDRVNDYYGKGAGELSLGDLRILLRFEFEHESNSFERWTGIYRVWEGPAYDADVEDLD